MLKKPKCPVIAIEEHYWDKELADYYQTVERNPEVVKRLHDLGELRIKEMDEAGVDIQVLSHGAPSTADAVKADAAEMARRVNDRLAAVIAQQPDRFAGFAALPTADPAAAADELERTVDKSRLQGRHDPRHANGVFLDDKRFWPIFERAQKLDVPIYLHPSIPCRR